MPFKPFGRVILTVDMPEDGLFTGDVGTIVEEHSVPGVDEAGYSLEFFDLAGNAVAVATVGASSLREPTQADNPTLRQQGIGTGQSVKQGWRAVFGAADKKDVEEVQRIIDEEFSRIDPEDRK